MYALVIYACVSGANCPPLVLTDQIPTQEACVSSPQTLATIQEYLAARPNLELEKFACAPTNRLDFYLWKDRV